jgi:hypothetical protein
LMAPNQGIVALRRGRFDQSISFVNAQEVAR